MRLKMTFQLKKPELDIEYRRAFLSLLKDCFKETSRRVFEKFYKTGTPMKPFTFGIFLPQPTFLNNTIKLNSTEITLNFSTIYSNLGTYFYSSLINRRKRSEFYPLPNNNSLMLKRVSLQPEKKITASEIVFKTLSPFLARLHHKQTNQDEYLTKNHRLFISQLKTIIKVMMQELGGIEDNVDFIPVKLNQGIPIKHFGAYVEGNTGVFKLIGRPEILDFIYKVGIGSRRSEGFGLLEVVA
jgi:CRISPR-associated endoribonuclease Cas6